MNVFLSYASERRPIADALAVGLRQDGHEVFFDRDDLPAGDAYHARIREAVARADLFVFLLSPESLAPSSYALTELDLARARWPSPAGHVLPIMVTPTPTGDVPPYLGAVTILEPRGDPVADALARIAGIARRGRRRRIAWTTIAIVALAGLAAAAVSIVELGPASGPCYLRAELTSERPGSTVPAGMVIDVSRRGLVASFIVSDDGRAYLDVGALTSRGESWTIDVRDAVGALVAHHEVLGCARTPRELPVAGGLRIVLGPR